MKIPILERVPTRISPCPIIEAVLEVRFVTTESWSVLPGLLYSQLREKYPEKRNLPLQQIPDEIRRLRPELTHKPLLQFVGSPFTVQLGPRVISLVTNNDYPGWLALASEMEWLLSVLESAGFVEEGERLGMRYIDFFEVNIFQKLLVDVTLGEHSLTGPELSLTKVFKQDAFTARLLLNNGAFIGPGDGPRAGSVLDLDIWMGPDGFELFADGMTRFKEAHDLNKQASFGLLKPELLATLSPEYA